MKLFLCRGVCFTDRKSAFSSFPWAKNSEIKWELSSAGGFIPLALAGNYPSLVGFRNIRK